MWTDFQGQDFTIGDYVVRSVGIGNNSHCLRAGWVIRETPKRIYILDDPTTGKRSESYISKDSIKTSVLLIETQRPQYPMICKFCGGTGHNYPDPEIHARRQKWGHI